MASQADKSAIAKKLAQELRSRPENQAVDSSWYCIAVCAFSAGNFGPGAVEIYLEAIKGRSPAEARIIFRRIIEAMTKTCLLYGIPKMLNAFYPLMAAVPGEDYFDTENIREDITNPLDTAERGYALFNHVYRDEAAGALEPYKHTPTLKVLALIMEYGYCLADFSILTPVETSQCVVASLIPQDVATQIRWHTRGLVRNGGSEKDLKHTVDITTAITDALGLKIASPIPEYHEVSN